MDTTGPDVLYKKTRTYFQCRDTRRSCGRWDKLQSSCPPSAHCISHRLPAACDNGNFRCILTARVFLNFLRRLLRLTRKTRRKVFLIADGHPVHKSRSVRRWLAEHAAKIRIFWLPSYSPELNPDELLNQDVKTNALGRVRPVNVQEMMSNVRSYLRITQGRPQLVQNFFRERHVQYAAS
ncbi:MAG: transposase [Candidatus Acidiferrum sp.]